MVRAEESTSGSVIPKSDSFKRTTESDAGSIISECDNAEAIAELQEGHIYSNSGFRTRGNNMTIL